MLQKQLVSILNVVHFHLNNIPDNFMNYMYATNDQWIIKRVSYTWKEVWKSDFSMVGV